MSFESYVAGHAKVQSKTHRKATLDDLMSFFHQLSTLVSAGTPLLRAIEQSARQAESEKLREVLTDIAQRIGSGNTFYTAASAYPNVFEHAWLEVIHTGEITGKMSFVLEELNKQVAEQRASKRRLKAALTYPIILLSVATLCLTAMLWFVVPTFNKMFKDMGAELPGITQFVVGMSDWIVANGLYAVGGIVAVVYAFKRYMRTEHGRRYVLGTLLTAPIFGAVMVQVTMYRFAANMALLLKSGVPMLETLQTMRGIFGHAPIYRDALEQVASRVASGHPLAPSLEETGLFTGMIVNTVRTGEESGQLATVMEQIAPYYKERADGMIAKVTKMMEPVIIMFMGTAVATMMLSIYMPMFEMSGKVK
jgi:type IV pilus assembly protein PilC